MRADDLDTNFKTIVNTLLDSLDDKRDGVNDAVKKSLCKIANRDNVNIVLPTCCEYKRNKKRIQSKHISNILSTIEQICMQKTQFLNVDSVDTVLTLTLEEMTSSKEYVPHIQLAASGILVALANIHSEMIITELMELLQPGIIPHFTIPHTLGAIATNNGAGIVPYVKPILAKMLPTLGMLKNDPLKQSFAYALGNLASATMDHLNNVKSLNIEMDNLNTEFSIAFDVLFIHWINSNEPKVIETILEAMGPMTYLLSNEKFEVLVSKLVSNILPLYKKSNLEFYFVTQLITHILTRTVKNNRNLLHTPILEGLNATLFFLVSPLPDYDQPQKLKSHFEILRCFDILLTNYSDTTLEFLFHRTRINNEDDKMKAIVILTHLLTASDNTFAENFILILKDNIGVDSSVKMKRILLKAIVALGYRQKLQTTTNCVLYEFIIKYICNTKMTEETDQEIKDLFNDCENSLYLLSSTVNVVKPILWPLLLEAFVQTRYSHSISILLKCLIQLTQVVEEDDDNLKNIKIYTPTNESVFVRCLGLLNYPHDEKLYRNILNFLLICYEDIHQGLDISWQLDLKNILTYLSHKDFSKVIWEATILDLFRSAIYLVNDITWIDNVCHKIIEQIPQCDYCVPQKGILYKFLAILISSMVDPQKIELRLDIYFNALPNSLPGEDKYIAQALGIASVKNGVRIVEKLDELCKEIDSRKSSRFLTFGFMKSSKQDISNLKYGVTLCYGEVAKELIDFNVLERFIRTDTEGYGTLVRWLLTILQITSPPNLVGAAVTTVCYLAKAINTLPHNIVLQDRWKLLNLSLEQIEKNSSKEDVEFLPKIIDAITSLALLPKYLMPEERNAVLRVIYNKITAMICSLEAKVINKTMNELEFQNILNSIQNSLDNQLKEFITQTTCPSTLDDILSILDDWIHHENKEIRLIAMKSIQTTLLSFIQNIKITYENPSRFNQSGFIMGRIISRCGDQYTPVRCTSVNCIKILIQIIDLYDGQVIHPDCESELTRLESEIITDDATLLSNVIEHIGDIVAEQIQYQQMVPLTESLLFGVRSDDSSAKACVVALNMIFKSKGADMFNNVTDIMSMMLATLQNINNTEKTAFLQTMLTFAKHHLKLVVAFLLMQPLPYEKCICECWTVLAQDTFLAEQTIEYFLTTLQMEPMFEESLKYDNAKVATVQYLSIISAMCEVLSQSETKNICINKFSELFALLYTTMACFVGASPPARSLLTDKKNDKFGFVPNTQSTKISPIRVAIDTSKALLINANCIKTMDVFVEYNQLESGDFLNLFLNTSKNVVAVFCEEYPQLISKLIASLNQYGRDSLIAQRIAVVTFFSHLVEFRCVDNLVMLDTVITTLNTGWRDPVLEVRAVSLMGLSNIKHLHKEQQETLMKSVISNLYHALDDHQGNSSITNIPLIAMINLNEFLLMDLINNELIELFTPILHRVKAFMNTENPLLREASIRLFGEIVYRQKSDSMEEQAFTLFPCFLLHLADDDANVVKASKQTLKKIFPIFNIPNSNTMIQNHLIDTAKLHLTTFITDLIKCMIGEQPSCIPQLLESTMNYLNSSWEGIRINSVIIVGLLFLNADNSYAKEEGYEKNVKILTFRLLQLLKDNNDDVRASAATALSNLYQA